MEDWEASYLAVRRFILTDNDHTSQVLLAAATRPIDQYIAYKDIDRKEKGKRERIEKKKRHPVAIAHSVSNTSGLVQGCLFLLCLQK